MRISFIIPAFNERATIVEVLERIDALGLDRQIDRRRRRLDRRHRGGAERLARPRRRRDPAAGENLGKGAAIRAAIPYIDGEIAVIQDADMEYDPADVPALVEPIDAASADVVYGSRLSGGRPQRAYMFWHLVGNRFLSLLTNVLFNTTISDMETGYKAFRADVLRDLPLRESGFGIEPEITATVCKRGLRIYEMPIAYYGRTYDGGEEDHVAGRLQGDLRAAARAGDAVGSCS